MERTRRVDPGVASVHWYTIAGWQTPTSETYIWSSSEKNDRLERLFSHIRARKNRIVSGPHPHHETKLALRPPFRVYADRRQWLSLWYIPPWTPLLKMHGTHSLYTGGIKNRILLSSLSAEYIRESTTNADLPPPPARSYFCSVKSLSFSIRTIA